VVFNKNFPDSAIGAVVGRIHTYHCGLWFNSPVDAKNAGALPTVTPFNDYVPGMLLSRTDIGNNQDIL